MSSLLNVSNGNSKSEEYQVGKVLGLTKLLMSVEGLDTQEMPQRDDIKAMVSNPYPWPEPKD